MTLEEKARLVREAIRRRDFDAALAMYAPDAVWDVSPLGLEGAFEGREAIRGLMEDMMAPYDDLEVVPAEFSNLGGGVTLSVAVGHGRPRGSSGLVERRVAVVNTWANGLIARTTWYSDIDEARAAAERLAEERRAMPAETLVRRTFDALLRGEYEEAARAFQADAIWHNTAEFPGPLRCDGLDAIIDFWTNHTELFDNRRDGKQEIEQVSGRQNVVAVALHAIARWPESGIPVDVHWAAAVQLRGEKISRVDVHGDFSKALDALGLEE
jgi:ketosteroid isomerase-like protein